MISTHFDLQNIINQLDQRSGIEEVSLESGTDEFSIAMTKIMESSKNYETSYAAGGKFSGDFDALHGKLDSETKQSGNEIEEEQLSGSHLPPSAVPHSPIEQIILGGKRQILVGRSRIDQIQSGLKKGAKQPDNPLALHMTTTGKSTVNSSLSSNQELTNNLEVKKDENAQNLIAKDESRGSSANHGKITSEIDGSGLIHQQAGVERSSLLAKLSQPKPLSNTESEQNLSVGSVQSTKLDTLDRLAQIQRSPETAADQFNAKEFNDTVIRIYKSHLDSSNIPKNTAVKIFLSPESLGQVQLDIVSEGSELRVTIGADRTEVVNLMRLNANSLQEQLSGEYNGKVSLDINNFKGENSQFQDQNQRGSKDESANKMTTTESQIFGDETETTDSIRNSTNSLFDTFV